MELGLFSLAVLVIAGVVSIPLHRTFGATKKHSTREDAQQWLRESGHLGATREVIQAERETYNKNHREIAASLQADGYYDFDGQRRSTEDDRPV